MAARSVPPTRLRVAQVLAFVGLVAALVGALGPAERSRTTYSWPPETLPETEPESFWYTPLLLARHRPESLSATLPCSISPPLRAGTEATALATARSPERAGGLAVRLTGGGFRLEVGADVLAAIDRGGCPHTVRLGGGGWSVVNGAGVTVAQGALDRMPVVTGLFSALDLGSGNAPSLELDTGVHASRTTLRQALAWIVAALALGAALVLVAFDRRPALPPNLVSRIAGSAHPVDAVVALALLAWWVLSPAFWDDGWIAARERMFDSSGGFSSYYDSLAGNLPVAYWLEWSQHWLTQSVDALLVLRVPSLLLLAATWILCRWIVGRIAAPGSATLWALTAAFLVGAMAGGMTLRPEPVTALFVVAVLACAVRFRESESAGPLVLVTVLVPLAILAHPAGVVSLAPLLMLAPSIFRWARANVSAAGTLLASAIGLFAVLAFVGADLEQRRFDAQWTRTYGPHADWRDELLRYSLLEDYAYGTPLRRAAVALIGLAVLSLLFRRRRNGLTLLDLPAASLGLTLILQLATPSRHPFQFGALLGIAAIAVAAETARLREDAGGTTGWRARPFLVLATATLAAAWAWSPRHGWNPLDLRTLEWTLGIEDAFPLQSLAVLLPFLLLAGALVGERRRRGTLSAVPSRVAAWTAPALAVPLMVFTAGVLVADTAKTDGWTVARQNLDTLRGDLGCGLADEELVVDRDSLAIPTARGPAAPVPSWVPPAPVAGLPRFALGPAGREPAATPWFPFPRDGRYAVFVAGTPGEGDRLAIESGRRSGATVQRLGTELLSPELVTEVVSDTSPWHLFGPSELPAPEADADVIRVVLLGGTEPGAAVAATAPVAFAARPLVEELRPDVSRTLVLPAVLTYLPCVELPRLADGTVEVPSHIVSPNIEFTPLGNATSPFFGLFDLYPVERVPWADGDDPPDEITAFRVDRRIPGAVELPALRATS